ncbi:MAG TPA: ATP-binding protein [Xanthobacteraceae bacterium]|jgi:two-component system, OmpR family, phosphate regulon sensor histidine kinase PhoR
MAPEDQRRTHDRTVSWLGRLKRARFVLIAGALVFLALDLMGALSALQAAIAFVIIGVVALIDAHAGEAPGVPALSPEGKPLPPDWLVEAVVSGLPDAVIALDRRGVVLALSASAREKAPTLARNMPLSFALRIPEITEAVRRAVATGEMQHVEFREKVPAERWSEAFVAPVALAAAVAGRRELFFVTLHDITRIKQVEEMRADFVANASHELRTPLASLSGFIETLQGPARNDPQARERFLDIMKAQANRMARLIDDLLSLSRIELKAHVQPEHQVDLAPIVRQVTDGLQTLARDRGVEVKIALPPEALFVRGDRDELIRVFENLIENALKYGAAGKRVDIALAREAGDNEATVAVRDYGPGIAPEHLPRLTERFYRVDVTESRAQGGTGLGLALVKHILHRHRGRLTIDSAPGKGATFTVRLSLDQRK